jgi:predicted Zn finger-like uncharacterized protein
MIIECVNCNKKFSVNSNLIPNVGREIKCGSCNHIWHFNNEDFLENITPIANKIEKQTQENDIKFEEKVLKNDIEIEYQVSIPESKQSLKITTVDNSKNIRKNLKSIKEINSKKIGNFFSYLLVFIISFVALIILLDTIKIPLINYFPGLEFILFNLFETLKDIKSFIIDLT